jgi:PIN domain nuclease of toxin-antitoxin system
VNLLLDSCSFIWLCSAPAQLSPPATEAIDADNSRLFLSVASAWEISLKVKNGKIRLPDRPWAWITGRAAYWQIEVLDVDLDAVCRSTEVPEIHKDPFDRLLVAHSLIHQLTILTPDPFVRRYPARTLW